MHLSGILHQRTLFPKDRAAVLSLEAIAASTMPLQQVLWPHTFTESELNFDSKHPHLHIMPQIEVWHCKEVEVMTLILLSCTSQFLELCNCDLVKSLKLSRKYNPRQSEKIKMVPIFIQMFPVAFLLALCSIRNYLHRIKTRQNNDYVLLLILNSHRQWAMSYAISEPLAYLLMIIWPLQIFAYECQ